MANEDIEKEKRELELQRQKHFSGGPGSQFISGGEQASDFKGTMSRLLQLLKPQLSLILLTFVMTIAYTVASTYAPNKLADMVISSPTVFAQKTPTAELTSTRSVMQRRTWG